MKAVILAAGMGSRMGKLTKDKPKTLLPFSGKTLLERQVENFLSFGISDIMIITGYKDNAIGFNDLKKIRNENFATTNMVESLFCSRQEWDQAIIVSYGDIVYEKGVLKKLIDSQHDISVVIDRNGLKYFKERFGKDFLSKTESLVFAGDGTISKIGEPNPQLSDVQGQYIGLLKFTPAGIKHLIHTYDQDKLIYSGKPWMRSKSFENGYMTDMVQRLIDKGYKVNPVIIERGWLEFDSEADHEIYTEWLKKGALSRYYEPDR